MAEPATQEPADAHRPQPGALDVAISRPGPAAVVLAVRGELDTLTAPELETALRGVLDGADTRLVVDLSEVTFLASSGLAVLIHGAHRADADGRVLHLVVSSRAVLRPLEVTGSDQLFTLHPDLDAALAG